MTGAVAVHEALGNGDLLSPAYSLRGLTPAEVKFFTAPVMGTDIEGTANVVYLDTTTGARMWSHLQTDSLGQNADESNNEALPTSLADRIRRHRCRLRGCNGALEGAQSA